MTLQQTIKSPATIGVFDSGIGGLSVLHDIRLRMPKAKLIYAADTAYLPYGNKSDAIIQQRAEIITRFLISQGAALIVVACNTATAAAVVHLRQTFDIPIIGMEPAIKPAASLTQTGVIAVLATENTSKSDRLASLRDKYAHHIKVLTQPCHGLVELVEANALDTPEAFALLNTYIAPLLENKADVIILGCTHYPFLKPAIQRLVGEHVTILDTGPAIARHTQTQFESLNLDSEQEGKEIFYCTSDAEASNKLLSQLWQTSSSFISISI